MNIILHQLHSIWHEHFEHRLVFKQIHWSILNPIYARIKHSEISGWRVVDRMAYPAGGLYSLRASPDGRYVASISEGGYEIVFILNAEGEYVYRHPYDKTKEQAMLRRFAETMRKLRPG